MVSIVGDCDCGCDYGIAMDYRAIDGSNVPYCSLTMLISVCTPSTYPLSFCRC